MSHELEAKVSVLCLVEVDVTRVDETQSDLAKCGSSYVNERSLSRDLRALCLERWGSEQG